jgi:UDP-N-acetylglucosamine 2-epimerase
MKIVVIIGTRPEAIKMIPVYLALRNDNRFEVVLVATGQHRQLLDQVFNVFNIVPDVDINLMKHNQTLAGLTASVLTGVHDVLVQLKPDAILVHGDTTTCFASTLAAFYEKILVGHVEAGLRTHNLDSPWPEEMNRLLVDQICSWRFAPTERAANNLLKEQIPQTKIYITGNTVVDTLLYAREKVLKQPPKIPGFPLNILNDKKLILVTGHRRESFGKPFEEFCYALREIVSEVEDVVIVYPVHLNPNVQKPVSRILGDQDSIFLIDPVEYLPFVYLMQKSHLIISDSGGIQEEAPSFGVPVLVTREVTERQEAIEAGTAILVGTNRENIVNNSIKLLSEERAQKSDSGYSNPFGDGTASMKIVEILFQEISGGKDGKG